MLKSLELAILAVALLSLTLSIFVYALFESGKRNVRIGIGVIKGISVLLGLVGAIWSLVELAHTVGSTLSYALLHASMLLVAGGTRLHLLLAKRNRRT
jgi:hypothetical protein